MRKLTYTIYLVLALVFVSGCSTLDKSYFATKAYTAPSLQTLTLHTGKSSVNRNDVEAYLKWLSLSRSEVTEIAAKRIAHEEEKANASSSRKLGLGVIGTGSAITSAALVTASAANAVWVSAFSGIAGGVTMFQASREAEGFSREAVAAVQSAVLNEISERFTIFNEAHAQLKAFQQSDLDGHSASWGLWQAAAEDALFEIYFISASPLIAVGGDESIKSYSDLQKELIGGENN